MGRERRVGRFQIAEWLVEQHPIGCRRVMGTVFVMRCEFLFHLGVFEYAAWSEHFDVVSEGEEAPWYVVSIHDGGAFITFDRFEP